MSLLEMRKYLVTEKGYNYKDIFEDEYSPVVVAGEISMYAHRNQKRENGEDYYNHPLRVLKIYQEKLGIVNNRISHFTNIALLNELKIPFYGVQEVCLLHDVIEDTDITIEEIEFVFDILKHDDYFYDYIKEPLLLITYNKNDDYDTYIEKIMTHPVAALVKLMDLMDNSKLLSLKTLSEKEYNRTLKYIKCAKKINDKYYFIEKFDKYRQLLKKE